MVISGDGDLSSIGGNHLIHAARRNMDMTVVCANNSIYGMTGDRLLPPPPGLSDHYDPQGKPGASLRPVQAGGGGGATFVARQPVGTPSPDPHAEKGHRP